MQLAERKTHTFSIMIQEIETSRLSSLDSLKKMRMFTEVRGYFKVRTDVFCIDHLPMKKKKNLSWLQMNSLFRRHLSKDVGTRRERG